MFIRKHTHGGYRGTEQVSGRGDYLALFSWNDYKALDELIAVCPDCASTKADRQTAIDGGNHQAYVWNEKCTVHTGQIHSGLPIPAYPNGKPMLWAIVRSCSLHQCGHFMMGTIRIGGKSLTVSGPCGDDGLPLDVQAVPPKYRDRLVQVPEDIALVYWTDNGHADIGGDARDRLRSWALARTW